MLNKVKNFVENIDFKSFLDDVFGKVDFYYLDFIFDEMENTKSFYLKVFLNSKIKIENFNYIRFLNHSKDFEKIISDFSHNDKYGEILIPKYNIEVHYSKDNILNADDFYDDDSWDEYPFNIFSSEVLNGIDSLYISAEEEKEEYILNISSEGNIYEDFKTFYDITGTLRFVNNSYQAISFYKEENLGKVIPKKAKILLADLSKKAEDLFGAVIPHEEVLASKNEYEEFLTNLKNYVNKDNIKNIFKDLLKNAFNYTISPYLVYNEQEGLEVRYYIEGYNFNWNSINRDILKNKGNINSSSYMLDKSEMGYLNRDSYHRNEILSGMVNLYGDVLLEVLNECINFGEQMKYGRKNFSICLGKGLIKDIVVVGDYSYFVNKNKEVIVSIKNKHLKNQDLFMKEVNSIILSLN